MKVLMIMVSPNGQRLKYNYYPDFLIETQLYSLTGLLEKVTPYTILKRHSWGSWDEFEELFRVPIRIAKIASQSEQVKNEVAGWLEEMGSAAYGVFPLGTEVDIKENSKSDAFNVFYQKIKAMREELSMLVLHQTMTTENGGSKAQGQVHENTLNELVYSDEKRILSILNDRLVPAMRNIGYHIPEGFKISVSKSKDPLEQIKIDRDFLSSGYILKKDYIEALYGTEIEQMPFQNQEAKTENPKTKNEKLKKALSLLKLHYRTKCCGASPISLTADFNLSRLIEDYLRNLFEEKKVPENQREQLWRYYYDKLSKGVDEGFSPQSSHYDKDLADALKLSIAEFSAFKETSFRKTIETLLVDENGSLRSWSEFKKEAYKVSNDYNHRWLETEYHQTIANAQMAEKWKGFEANADLFPNLKLVSVKDGRVRPEHQVLDGTIRPLNDPFWKTHTPPLDWGCRCDVIQTDEPPTEIKGGLQLKIEFENNPAISGKIFGGSVYEKTLTKDEITEAKKKASIEASKRNLLKLSQEQKDYRKILQQNAIHQYSGVVIQNIIDIKITTKGIKEFINQPHKYYFDKNELVKDLPNLIKNAKYLGKSPYHKDNADIVFTHIFEIDVKDEKSWLLIREGKDGKINFYSISDNNNVLKDIKKG